MGVPVLQLPDEALIGRRQYGFFDDFFIFITTDEWTSIESDSGSSTSLQSSVGGQLDLVAGGVDENEVYLYRTAESFKMANDKPFVVEARISWAEINTDDANVIFGAWNAVAADDLADAGAGPRAGATDGYMFFTTDGELNWSVETSDGADAAATRTTTELTAANSLDGVKHVAAPGATTWQTLRIEAIPQSSTRQNVSYFIDGTLVKQHDMTYTTATEITPAIGAKCGSANTLTIQIDYIFAYQLR